MTAFDPATHREPTTRDQFGDEDFQPRDRVCMVGTDLYGTVMERQFLGSQALVEWDYITHENGERSWTDTDLLILVAVAR